MPSGLLYCNTILSEDAMRKLAKLKAEFVPSISEVPPHVSGTYWNQCHVPLLFYIPVKTGQKCMIPDMKYSNHNWFLNLFLNLLVQWPLCNCSVLHAKV